MSPNKGLLAMLEGGDGVGKSTQIFLLKQAFEAIGRKVVTVAEPGSTELAQAMRELLLGENIELSPEEQMFLLCVARVSLYQKVIIPALERGDVVISDRGWPSTWVYQGDMQEVPKAHIEATAKMATFGHMPNLLIVLDADEGTFVARRSGTGLDKMERKMESCKGSVYEGYRAFVKAHPEFSVLVDARRSKDQVFRQICEVIKVRLGIELNPVS